MYEHLYQNRPIIARHRWLALCEGFQGEPYVVSSPGVFIVPLDEAGNVLFMREPSRVDGVPVLFLPGGAQDDGEDAAISANRELQEEIGYKAGRLDFLAEMTPLSRHSVWDIQFFLARDLTPSRLPGDEDYELPIERVPLAAFEAQIHAGRLKDANLIAALFLARDLIAREAASGAPT